MGFRVWGLGFGVRGSRFRDCKTCLNLRKDFVWHFRGLSGFYRHRVSVKVFMGLCKDCSKGSRWGLTRIWKGFDEGVQLIGIFAMYVKVLLWRFVASAERAAKL